MTVPDLIRPMLARGGGTAFDDDGFGFEIKWDGLRALAIRDGGFRIQNRHLRAITHQFPELDFAHLPDGCAIDGEIIVFKDGGPSFNALQRRSQLDSASRIELAATANPATFVAFDLIYEGGGSIADRPLSERRARLEELIEAGPHDRLLLTDQIAGAGRAYFEAARDRGLEGVIAKRLDSPYLEDRRTAYWTKIVAWRLEAFEVLGYVKEPREARVKSIVVGQRDGDGWVRVGRVGGLDDEEKPVLYEALKDMPPLDSPPDGAANGIVWRKTGLSCRIRYFPETVTGGLRLPRFKGWLGR